MTVEIAFAVILDWDSHVRRKNSGGNVRGAISLWEAGYSPTPKKEEPKKVVPPPPPPPPPEKTKEEKTSTCCRYGAISKHVLESELEHNFLWVPERNPPIFVGVQIQHGCVCC